MRAFKPLTVPHGNLYGADHADKPADLGKQDSSSADSTQDPLFLTLFSATPFRINCPPVKLPSSFKQLISLNAAQHTRVCVLGA